MALPKPVQSADVGKGPSDTGKDEDIKEPHEHDVLCGRGGSINSWKGNERFRTLVEKRKRVYLTARFKREKRLIASSIVQEIQSLEPPGRFLSRNTKKGTWFVIDDDKARDKVSQALRENAPSIRAEIETEINVQRAEIQRSQHEPHHPPPPNAPPNPYYPQGWGYFSYYGYAQQSSHHPPGSMPPPPPHYHPGYNNPQWNHPNHPPQHPPQQSQSEPPRQPAGAYSSATNPTPQQQQEPPQSQQPAQTASQVQAAYRVPPPSQPAPAPAPPPKPKKDPEPQQEHEDEEKSVFSTADIMSVLPLSIASWTRDALSIGGAFSLTSNNDDQQDSGSVSSKPLRYIHQPEDNRSVTSKGARSVRFKDGRSISGRSLEPRKNAKPPRIMHSSQINFPRRVPRRNSNGTPQRVIVNPNNPMAPLSSVNLDDHNDGMISLITTEGMNSIMEESTLNLDDYDQDMLKAHFNQDYEPLSANRLQRTGRSPAGRRRRRSNESESSHSMFRAVANQIVMGTDNWEGNAMACNPESGSGSISLSEMMAVEIEGQEVQLVDDTLAGKGHNSVIEDRTPPHDKERLPKDWPSRVGSCHSFLNDSLAGASFFSTGLNSRGDAVSPADSMDMDVSSGTDPFSVAGGSVGGASLCRVFDAEASGSHNHSASQGNSQSRMLTQMPSWERALRSPMGSQDVDNDQESFMTKSSEKLMGGSISTIGSIEINDKQNGAMAFENRKKE